MIDRKLVKNIDFVLLLAVIALIGISVTVISSATHVPDTGNYSYIQRQLVWFVLSLFTMFAVIMVDYNTVGSFAYMFYAGSILFLLLVKIPGIGVVRNGARSWIDLGVSSIQPSEFAKLGIIISFAKLLENRKDKLRSIKELIIPAAFVGLPIVLVLTEPDLGGALVFVAIFIGMIFVAGISYKLVAWGAALAVAAVPAAWLWVLEAHQKNRILAFLNPDLDPLGIGYHVIQSKIAVGSGRLLGKGLYNGTQNKLNFLPYQHTDFIFSVLGEELGFVGALVVILLLFLVLFRILDTARSAKDEYGALLSIGVLSMLTFQVFENIGMTIGLMPVTGITLPFMSYGGSSLLVNMIAIGIVINVGMRKQKINF
jgi:rod shape determining protein RodA